MTEALLLDDSPAVAGELRRLGEAGIGVTMDDFGSGHSALSWLTKCDIGVLKVHRSLVRDLGTDPNDRALVEAIIVMAHKLGIRVVAGGVETPEQRDLLIAAGCDFGQGFLFAPPLPPESVWAQWSTIRI